MKIGKKLNLCLLLLIAFAGSVAAQELITNVYGRDIHSLNGKMECHYRPVRSGTTNENL